MKTNIDYLSTVIYLLFGLGVFTNSCTDYDYKTDNSFYDNVKVNVKGAVDNILSINLYNEEQITLEVDPEDLVLDVRAFIYTISDTTVLAIDASGNVNPLKEGVTDVDVVFRANNKVSTSFKIRIWRDPVSVQEIKIPDNVKNTKLKVDQVFDLASTITILPGNADNKVIEYTSEDPTIAKIDKDGIITGVSEGTTKIILTSTDGSNVKAECNVSVVPEVKVSEIQIPTGFDDRTVGLNQTIDLGSKIVVLPETADIKDVTYELLEGSYAITIDNNGIIKTIGFGTTKIRINSTDGSGVFKEFTLKVDGTLFDRLFWKVTTSIKYGNGQNYVTDGSTGKPEDILDGDANTFLSLVKPGKTYSGYTTPAGYDLNFVVDMDMKQTFNYLQWSHRGNNTYNYLRVWGIDVYGSDDGVSFTAIKTGIAISYDNNTTAKQIDLPESKYRYVKVALVKWSDNSSGGSTSGSTLQIGEFNLGVK